MFNKIIKQMKTNKDNNEALVNKLENIIDEIDIKKRCIESKREVGDDSLVSWFEVDLWLLEKQK